MPETNTPADIAVRAGDASERIAPYVLRTPMVRGRFAEWRDVGQPYFKCEHRQITGSFKLRGALNKALALPRGDLDAGLVVASTGNHGAAVAYACRLLGGKCTVVVPEGTSSIKIEAMEALGAQIRVHGADGLDAERFARRTAAGGGAAYISPYNDPDVIAGQGTVGVEMLSDVDNTSTVYVAVGGGGLISGVAAVLKETYPEIRIVGCSPENHPVMDESVRAGRIVDLPLKPTLSDGTAGGLESDTITLPLCAALVDDWIRVSEPEIRDGLRYLARRERLLVEGAAAVAFAATLKDVRYVGGKRVVVLCGSNIDRDLLSAILAEA